MVTLLFGAMMGAMVYWTSHLVSVVVKAPTEVDWISLTFVLPMYVLTMMFIVNGWLYFSRAFFWHKESAFGEALTFVLGFACMITIVMFTDGPDFAACASCALITGLLVTAKVGEIAHCLNKHNQKDNPLYQAARDWAANAIKWLVGLTIFALIVNLGREWIEVKIKVPMPILAYGFAIAAVGGAVYISGKVMRVLEPLQASIREYVERSKSIE
jgi:hypothetical protein